MEFKRIFIAIGFFCLGFISVIGMESYLSHPKDVVIFQPLTPTPTPATMLIPQNAYQGRLSQTTGITNRIPWNKTDAEAASSGAILYQGDEIITKEKSTATFTLTASISGTLHENTHIIFGSLLQHKVTIQQTTGAVEYKADDIAEPLSIRSLGALIQLDKGIISISVKDKIISLVLESGTATLAYINNNNITHEWKLTSRDVATIYDTEGIVHTTGQLLPQRN